MRGVAAGGPQRLDVVDVQMQSDRSITNRLFQGVLFVNARSSLEISKAAITLLTYTSTID